MVPDDNTPDRMEAAANKPFAQDAAAGSVATQLVRRREAMDWNIHDIAAALRIRPEYLQSLERGSLDGLPGPAYAMGFLRAYADYLGLDGLRTVERFKAEQSSLNLKPELTFPMPLTERGIPGSGLLLTAAILIGLCYGTWYYLSSAKHSALPEVQPVPAQLLPKPVPPVEQAVKQLPALPAPVAATASPTTAPLGGTAAVTPVPPQPLSPAAPLAVPPVAKAPIVTVAPVAEPAPVTAAPIAPQPEAAVSAAPPPAGTRVVIEAVGNSWIQVYDNGKIVLTKLMHAGDTWPVPDHPGMTLWTGNAGGLRLRVDGTLLPPAGTNGQVKRHLVLSPQSLLAPTAQAH